MAEMVLGKSLNLVRAIIYTLPKAEKGKRIYLLIEGATVTCLAEPPENVGSEGRRLIVVPLGSRVFTFLNFMSRQLLGTKLQNLFINIQHLAGVTFCVTPPFFIQKI
ncbi:hypothetical protein ACFL11_00070 [Patescibacteria group bacterium]